MKPDRQTIKKHLLFTLVAAILGVASGIIVWLFLRVLTQGSEFIWEVVPEQFSFSAYPLVICTVGGLLVGWWRKRFGDYPEDLENVMTKVKANGRYDSNRVIVIFVAALLPLLFGASLGPEAGLVCVIAALATYVGDRFKYLAKEMEELPVMGISATLGVLFSAPLFGFIAPIEGEADNLTFPKRQKVVIYLATILCGLGTNYLLVNYIGGGFAIARFETSQVGTTELIWAVPLALVGILSGLLYHLLARGTQWCIRPLERFPIWLAITGGALLGLIAIFDPYALFSGEHGMFVIIDEWTTMGAIALLLIGLVKLFVTNVCLASGWRGGHIFPVIFAGVCIGFGMAKLTGVDAVFAVAVVSTSLSAAVIKKPIAVILIMLLLFPIKEIIILTAAAFIGAALPLDGRGKQLTKGH
ncbi:MAG: chloride channel protein [Lachnospiraceae bacterium]|jgi:H+/Cl- antiporter ClcA|nr:chloride channel protein [Lachnospiraceae bacterium]